MLDFEVHVKDPCISLANISAPANLNNPPDYFYEPEGLYYTVDPPFTASYECEIEYRCEMVSGPSVEDVCSYQSG